MMSRRVQYGITPLSLGMFVFCLAAVVCGAAEGQPADLYPMCEHGQWGFIDGGGKVVVPPQFAEVRTIQRQNTFSEGLSPAAAVKDGKKVWGFIDGAGKFVVEPRFSGAGSFSAGRAPVSTEKRLGGDVWGLIDRQGSQVMEPCCPEPPVFSDGLALMPKKYRPFGVLPHGGFTYGYVDEKGNWVIKADYAEARPFHAGLAIVRQNTFSDRSADQPGEFSGREYLVIDRSGKTVKKLNYALVEQTKGDLVAFCAELGSLWGYLDAKGEVAIAPRFKEAGFFENGYAPCSDANGLWGVVDVKGVWVVAPRYGQVGGLPPVYDAKCPTPVWNPKMSAPGRDQLYRDLFGPERMLRLKSRSNVAAEWGYMDASGKLVKAFEYTTAGHYANGLAVAGKLDAAGEERFGYVKPNGEWLVPPRFIFAGPFNGRLAEVILSVDGSGARGGIAATIGCVDQSGTVVWQGKTILSSGGLWASPWVPDKG